MKSLVGNILVLNGMREILLFATFALIAIGNEFVSKFIQSRPIL